MAISLSDQCTLCFQVFSASVQDCNVNQCSKLSAGQRSRPTLLVLRAAVRCDVVLRQASRARRVRKAGVGGEVRHGVTSDEGGVVVVVVVEVVVVVYLYVCVYIYICFRARHLKYEINQPVWTPSKAMLRTETRGHQSIRGQFSNVRSRKAGPAPERFELSKGIVKRK